MAWIKFRLWAITLCRCFSASVRAWMNATCALSLWSRSWVAGNISNNDFWLLLFHRFYSQKVKENTFFSGKFLLETGVDLGNSRGGKADFRLPKKFFSDLPNHYKDRNLTKLSAQQTNFWKNAKKSCFFGARSPLKISTDWRQRRLWKQL